MNGKSSRPTSSYQRDFPAFEQRKNERRKNWARHAVQIVSADLLFIALVLDPDLSRSVIKGKWGKEWDSFKPVPFCLGIPGTFFVFFP